MKEKMQTISENLKWSLKADRENRDIITGIMRSLAVLVKNRYPTYMPSYGYIWDIYNRVEKDEVKADRYAIFIKELHSVYKSLNHNPRDQILISDSSEHITGSVSYVKNPAAEKALSAFSAAGRLTRVVSTDFKNACENVYYDRTEYCLLPLENSSEGLLYAFRRLAEKYELKILSAVKIALNDDEFFIMGLFSSVTPSIIPGGICELCVGADSPWNVGELAQALPTLDSSIKRINFIPAGRIPGYYAHICLKCGGDPAPLNTFFNSAYPSFTYYGSYKSI